MHISNWRSSSSSAFYAPRYRDRGKIVQMILSTRSGGTERILVGSLFVQAIIKYENVNQRRSNLSNSREAERSKACNTGRSLQIYSALAVYVATHLTEPAENTLMNKSTTCSYSSAMSAGRRKGNWMKTDWQLHCLYKETSCQWFLLKMPLPRFCSDWKRISKVTHWPLATRDSDGAAQRSSLPGIMRKPDWLANLLMTEPTKEPYWRYESACTNT